MSAPELNRLAVSLLMSVSLELFVSLGVGAESAESVVRRSARLGRGGAGSTHLCRGTSVTGRQVSSSSFSATRLLTEALLPSRPLPFVAQELHCGCVCSACRAFLRCDTCFRMGCSLAQFCTHEHFGRREWWYTSSSLSEIQMTHMWQLLWSFCNSWYFFLSIFVYTTLFFFD